jgi:hypothetical protein
MTKNFKKIVSLIAPYGMTPEEYVIRCTVNGVEASLKNPLFAEWLIRTANEYNDECIHPEIFDLIIKTIYSGELFNLKEISKESDEILSDVLVDLVLSRNKSFKENFFGAILKTVSRSSESWQTAYHLNKGFGFTNICYFKDANNKPTDHLNWTINKDD